MNWNRVTKLNNNQKSKRYYMVQNKKEIVNPLEKALQEPKRKFDHAAQVPNGYGPPRDMNKHGVPVSELFVPSSMSYGYYMNPNQN